MQIKRVLAGVSTALIVASSNACADNYFLLVKAVGKITDDIASLKSRSMINLKSTQQNKAIVYANKKNIASLKAKNTVMNEKLDVLKKKVTQLTEQLRSINTQKNNIDQNDIKVIKNYINK